MSRAIALAGITAVLLVATYLLVGGATYAPHQPPNPCCTQAPDADGLTGTVQRVGLTALESAACDLGVRPREPAAGTRRPAPARHRRGAPQQGVPPGDRARARRGGASRADRRRGVVPPAGGLAVRPMDAVLERLFAGS